MKKKVVALVLALSMVLTMMPMQLFANMAWPVIPGPTEYQGVRDGLRVDNTPNDAGGIFSIGINLADIAGQTAGPGINRLVLPITLSGAGSSYLRFVNWSTWYTPNTGQARSHGQVPATVTGSTWSGGALNGENFLVEFQATGYQTGFLLLTFEGEDTLPGPGDHAPVGINLPMTLPNGVTFPAGTRFIAETAESANQPPGVVIGHQTVNLAEYLVGGGLILGQFMPSAMAPGGLRFQDPNQDGSFTLPYDLYLPEGTMILSNPIYDDARIELPGADPAIVLNVFYALELGVIANSGTIAASTIIPADSYILAGTTLAGMTRADAEALGLVYGTHFDMSGSVRMLLTVKLTVSFTITTNITIGGNGGIVIPPSITTPPPLPPLVTPLAITFGAFAGITPASSVTNNVIPAGANGLLEIQLPLIRVRSQAGDARVNVRLHTDSGPTLVDRPLAAFPGTGVTFRTGDPVVFEFVAGLGRLDIREQSAGAFNVLAGGDNASATSSGRIAIRLLAPNNYFWGEVNISGTNNTVINGSEIQNVNSLNIRNVTRRFLQHPNGRHELVLFIDIGQTEIEASGRHSGALAAIPAELRLNGLQLIPNENAPQEHNVNIDVQIGRVDRNVAIPSVLDHSHFGTTSPYRLHWSRPSGHYINNWHVATRSRANIEVRTYGDQVDIRSGQVGNWVVDSDASTGRYEGVRPENRTAGLYRLSTQRLQIIENVPNAFTMGPGSPLTFTFPQGVEVLGIRYRFYNHAGSDGPSPPAPAYGFLPAPANDNASRSAWRVARRPQPGTTGATLGNLQTVQFTSNAVTLRDIMPHVTQGSSRTRRIDIYFDLSITPGFAADVADQAIVTISGAAAGNIHTGNRSIAVANIFDPVFVDLVGGPLQVGTGVVHNLIGPTPIGDLVIAETDGGMFTVGETILIYATGTYMPRPDDLVFTHGVARTDANSGLRLSAGRQVNVNVGGRLIRAMEFEVISESSPDTPGYITLSGNRIAGFVYPGEDYRLVVAGSVIAANSQIMAARRAQERPSAETTVAIREGRAIGMFDVLPYSIRFVEFGEFTMDPNIDIPPPTTPPTYWPGLPQPRPEHWLAMAHPFTTTDGEVVNPPVYFRTFRANDLVNMNNVGFVSLRVFADLVGADILIDYPVAGQVTIRGSHSDGVRTVTVTVATGNPIMGFGIDGSHNFVDIATFSGAQTDVVMGSIYAINLPPGRLFLPFRAVANAFGYEVDGMRAPYTVVFH